MLWTIAATLVALWLLGLITGYTMGSFIHILFAAAIILLVVKTNQEVSIYQDLREKLRTRRYNKVKSECAPRGD